MTTSSTMQALQPPPLPTSQLMLTRHALVLPPCPDLYALNAAEADKVHKGLAAAQLILTRPILGLPLRCRQRIQMLTPDI